MNKTTIMLDFKRINSNIHKALTNRIREYDGNITPVQARILMFIEESKEVTATDIIEGSKFANKSTISEVLNNMEKNGFIIRSESKNDSRKKIIELTKKSRDTIEVLKSNFDKVASKVLDGISDDEYETFREILDKMERNINDIC